MRVSLFGSKRRAIRQAIRRGDLARDQRQWTDARKAYAEALDIEPLLHRVWVQYGHSLKESGLFAEAEAAYQRSLVLFPGVSDTYLQLGHVMKLQNALLDATNAYAAAVAINPGDVEAAREYETMRQLVTELLATKSATTTVTNPGHVENFSGPRAVFIGNYEAIACLDQGLRIYVDTRDIGISAHLMTIGDWEPWIRRVLMGLIRPGMRVLDVGANFGFYTLLMAHAVGEGGKVFSVEANPHLLQLLKKSISVNGLGQRVRLIEKAACEKSARLLFSYDVQWSGGGRLSKVQNTRDRMVTIEVDAVPLDALIEGPIDVIKIDIEGGEEMALLGMKRLIDKSPSLAIVMEYSKSSFRDASGFWHEFHGKGFRFRLIEPAGLSEYLAPKEVLAIEDDTRYLLLQR